MNDKINYLSNIANVLRADVLKMTTKAGSGHPTSCLSCAEIISCLLFNEMQYDTRDPTNQDNDEFILSKGHAAPILYSALHKAGCINQDLMTLRQINSDLEGHPIPSLRWIKVATGSLGQGLSVGVGISLAAKLQQRKQRTYVLLGDSEVSEGSVYEAFNLASHYKLNNLCAIVDVNRLGQSGETMFGHDLLKYKRRFEALDWNAIVVDGHNVEEILCALLKSKEETTKPTVIIAKTVKGKGVSFLEDKDGWHGKVLSEEQLTSALEKIQIVPIKNVDIQKPKKTNFNFEKSNTPIKPNYNIGDKIGTRDGYGNALVKLARENNSIIAIDAEVKNSTFSEKLLTEDPKKFIEAYVAEQNMVGVALGLSIKGYNVFASSFASFLTRAHDQIRMASLSEANLTLVGSHSGLSAGEDGPSQMGLEDIAMFRCLSNSIILSPSDAVSAEKLTELASNTMGLKYIRTTKIKTDVVYDNSEKFDLGDFKILKKSDKDVAVVVGSGITLHEALKAHKKLEERGIQICVVDLYCIKPFNTKKLLVLVKTCGNKVVVVEDHYTEGGIGEMICKELNGSGTKINCLSVKEKPHSGKPDILLNMHKIDSNAIIGSINELQS